MTTFLAHVGGRTDLPVPLSFFVIGAGLAIVVSFVMLSASWLEPRLQDESKSKTARCYPWVTQLGVGIGSIGLSLVIAAGLFDGSASTRSIGPVLVWIVFWLVIPFASVIIGGLWRWMSPYRRLVHGVSRGRPERNDLFNRIGVWPATFAFVAFVWVELVYPKNTLPQTLAILAVAYAAYLVVLSRVLGPETALRSGAAFERYTGVISHIAPRQLITTDSAGTAMVKRRWLAALPGMTIHKGMTAFIIAMIGTVTYDGMSGASWWRDLVGDLRREMWFETLALLGTVATIGLLYYLAAAAAKRLAGSERPPADIADSFAHTLVPIAFAYAFAHYFSLVIYEGQQLLHNASDPFGQGWNLFGTADWQVVFGSSQGWIWYVQVAIIVVGHIAGMVLAHDRALGEFGGEVAVRTQYAMLVLMVALTSLGLFILAG